ATVSNIPAYPKKLPIVLIATLATLLLSTGLVVTGELLRMTAPRALAVVAAAIPMMTAAPVAPAPEAVPATPVAPPEPVVAAAAREKEPELSVVAQADAPAPRDEIA